MTLSLDWLSSMAVRQGGWAHLVNADVNFMRRGWVGEWVRTWRRSAGRCQKKRVWGSMREKEIVEENPLSSISKVFDFCRHVNVNKRNWQCARWRMTSNHRGHRAGQNTAFPGTPENSKVGPCFLVPSLQPSLTKYSLKASKPQRSWTLKPSSWGCGAETDCMVL